jgi:hypothetical protein
MTEQAEKPRLERMSSQNFGALEFKRNTWFYELTEAQTKEDLSRPEFWADKSDQVRGHDGRGGIGDLMLLDKPDSGWSAWARINVVGKGFLKISIFSECKPEQVEVAKESPLATRWNPGRKCHEVIRASSKDLMASGFQQKADAVAWINDHLRQMAA